MDRNREIYLKHKNGKTKAALAREYHLTTESITRIIKLERYRDDTHDDLLKLGLLPSLEERMRVYFFPKFENTDMEKHLRSIIYQVVDYFRAPKEPEKFIGWFLLLDETDTPYLRNIGKKKWQVIEKMQEEIRNPAISGLLTKNCQFVSKRDYLYDLRKKERNQNGI